MLLQKNLHLQILFYSMLLNNHAEMIKYKKCLSVKQDSRVVRRRRMEKKNIDWANLGFGYIETEKRYVSNFKRWCMG